MTREDIEKNIREDIKVDIYGDLYNVDRVVDWFLSELEVRDSKIKSLEKRLSDLS